MRKRLIAALHKSKEALQDGATETHAEWYSERDAAGCFQSQTERPQFNGLTELNGERLLLIRPKFLTEQNDRQESRGNGTPADRPRLAQTNAR